MTDSPLVASPETLGGFCWLRQAAFREWSFTGGRRKSPDPVIAGHHFTNVYRHQDPGTVFAEKLYAGLGVTEAVWRAVAYRLTNRRDTWDAYHDRAGHYPAMSDTEHWLAFLHERRAGGEKVFTGRHMTVGMPRYAAALRYLVDRPLLDTVPEAPAEFAEWLLRVPGVGQFFVWQVTADLMTTRKIGYDPGFVILGPGAKFGLRWIEERRPFAETLNDAGRRVVSAGNGHLGDARAHELILQLRDTQGDWLPAGMPPMTLVDLEHALCEYGRWGVLWARRERAGK